MPTMTTYERAIQIYQVLIAAAHNRQTVTYDLLGKLTGIDRRGLGHHLDHLQSYCVRHDLPPLTVLVVHTGGGRPGSGLTASQDIDQDREMVYRHEWYKMKPLTAEALAEGAGQV